MVAVFQPVFVFPEEAENKTKKNRAEEHRFEKSELCFKKRQKKLEKVEGGEGRKEAGRNTRQQWIAEWLSLTLGWPGFTHCCWPPSSTDSRLLTPMSSHVFIEPCYLCMDSHLFLISNPTLTLFAAEEKVPACGSLARESPRL